MVHRLTDGSNVCTFQTVITMMGPCGFGGQSSSWKDLRLTGRSPNPMAFMCSDHSLYCLPAQRSAMLFAWGTSDSDVLCTNNKHYNFLATSEPKLVSAFAPYHRLWLPLQTLFFNTPPTHNIYTYIASQRTTAAASRRFSSALLRVRHIFAAECTRSLLSMGLRAPPVIMNREVGEVKWGRVCSWENCLLFGVCKKLGDNMSQPQCDHSQLALSLSLGRKTSGMR